MGYTNDELNDILDKTEGHCHLCGKKLCFGNYAEQGARGAWEVDHSRSVSQGGTDYFRNLFPACIDCNRSKGTRSSHTLRRSHGIRLRKSGASPSRPSEGALERFWNDLLHGR